jgi:hypothetical protein
MIGLGYMLFFWLYFLLSRAVVRTFAATAKQFHGDGRLWGFLGGFLMYNVLFFDLIPVHAVHYYECETEGGLTVYKTIEEWKRENPGVAETLNSNPQVSQSQYEYLVKNEHLDRFYRLPDDTELVARYDVKKNYMYTEMQRKDGSTASWLNQRFIWESRKSMAWYIVRRNEELIIDSKTNEVIAKFVDFDTTAPNNPVETGGAESWRDYVSFLKISSCENQEHYNGIKFHNFRRSIKLLGENK